MQISNFLSESFLTLSGFSTFYFLLRKLPLTQIILWGTFILSVSITSFFSALYFAGVSGMNQWHDFFKNIGSSAGIILLVLGIYSLVFKKNFSSKTVVMVVTSVFAFSMIGVFLNLEKVFETTPLIGILIVLLLGIIALIKRNKDVGFYLLSATFFSILANTFNLLKLPINQLSIYCFLLSCVLICFGLAAKRNL
ncbi:MAG: hypothetical protein RLZZ306_186 [Bacteroidota bacterium]|jgi:hypothetical protein